MIPNMLQSSGGVGMLCSQIHTVCVEGTIPEASMVNNSITFINLGRYKKCVEVACVGHITPISPGRIRGTAPALHHNHCGVIGNAAG